MPSCATRDAHIGIPVHLMGKVGDDFSRQIIRQLIASQHPGLGSGLIVDPAANTSYTIVISPPGIDRILFHCPGAKDTFSAADIRYISWRIPVCSTSTTRP